jgi:hypothetical protein
MTQLIGVYDADATVWGELSYWVGARLGVRHCSLCHITHGMFREKEEWKKCRAQLGVEFLTFHRDDQPEDVRDFLDENYPAVVLRDDAGSLVLFMNEEEISACGHSPELFIAEILRRLRP